MNKSVAVTTIVIIAIGLVTLIMLLQTCSTSPRELTNTLNIEVFAQCPIVDDSLDFQGEANGFVSHFSTGQPSPLFLNPIVSFARLDQSGIAELSGLASDSIEIPVEFMNSFRAGVFPEQYTLEDRKMEEDEYLNVTCAEDQNYIRFRHNAIRASTCEPLQIKYDMNDTIKEFLIDHSLASDYSDRHKKWKNSQLLHSYIEMLIANKMVKANDAIRVIYLRAPKVVVVADRDKDGVADEVDQCPDIKGEKRCEGCVCPPVVSEVAPETSPKAPVVQDIQLSYLDRSNNIKWKRIKNADKIKVSVQSSQGGRKAFSMIASANGAAESYSFSVEGGEKATYQYTIEVLAYDKSGAEIPLKNNKKYGVLITCTE